MPDNAYRQDCHARMLQYVSGVNYNVNSNYTKYLAQFDRFFCVLENFRRKFANPVAQAMELRNV